MVLPMIKLGHGVSTVLGLWIGCLHFVSAGTILYDGRAPLNLTSSAIDASSGPYLTVVKGSQRASHYSTLLRPSIEPPTPLWNKGAFMTEQTISITLDNSSVFVPGGGAPQYGFRRTEYIAQKPGSGTAALNVQMQTGVTVFHFSVKADEKRLLNYMHEQQIVFIEPSDGTHVFGIQLGSPFTIPSGQLPAKDAHSFKVLGHALNVIFTTPFVPFVWHNFAVQVDWDKRTLAAFYSKDKAHLQLVTKGTVPNSSAGVGAAGRGDFHFGVLKLPLANPSDSSAEQRDVAHHGIQEGTTEGLLYSGVFVENTVGGVSVGGGVTTRAIS